MIIVDYISNKTLERNCDFYVLNHVNFSTASTYLFSSEEIYKIINNNNNVRFIINMDKVIHEKELNSLNNFLKKYININNCSFLFSDISFLEIVPNQFHNKLIYSNPSYIQTKEIQNFFIKLNIKTILSHELSLKEMLQMNMESAIVDVFGHSKIFYSKRKLLNLFEKQYKIELPNKNMNIQEINREDRFIINENKVGTLCYSSNIISYLEECKYFTNIKLLSDFIDEEKYYQVIGIFKNYNKYTSTDIDKLLSIKTSKGFLYGGIN